MKKFLSLLALALLSTAAYRAMAQQPNNDTIIPPLPYTPDTVRYGDSSYYFAPRHGIPNAMYSGYHHSPTRLSSP